MRIAAGVGALLVALILLLVSPAGVTGTHVAVPPTAAPTVASSPLMTDALPLPAHVLSLPLNPSTPIGITLTLPYADSGRLAGFLAAVENPTAPQYREFLTASQFRAEFDPNASAVADVTSVLLAHGATELSAGPDRATVSAYLPAGAVDALFGVQLRGVGTDHGIPLYTAVGSASLPPLLQGRVVGIGGLSNSANADLTLDLTHSVLVPVTGNSAEDFVDSNTSQQWFVGSDFTQAYGASDLFPGGTIGARETYPTHEAIATLLFSSWNQSTGENLPPWDPNVIDTYFNNTSAPGWPATHVTGVPVTVLGQTAPMPGSLGTMNDSSGAEFENSLDLEMAGDLAPGSSIFNFYIPGSVVQNGSLSDLADDLAATLSGALNYNYDGLQLSVVTGSFGLPDLNDSAWDSALEEAAATGVTVGISSGDQGNAPDADTGRSDGQWPTWPATSAFNTSGAISVGGVSLSINGVPTATYQGKELNVTYDSNETGISGMTAWWSNEGPAGGWAGSEGGLSTVIPEPSWQFHSAAQPAIASAGDMEGTGFLGRAGPDIAFPANSTLAYVYANASESLYFAILEGTSIAAPVFAGLLADEAAVLGHPFGYLDPELYRMGGFYATNAGASDPFLSVTVGGNYVFSAGPGWNAVTGWGGLAAPLFLTALSNSTVDNYTYTGATPGLSSPSSPNSFPLTALVLIVVLGIAAGVALVIAFGRPRRSAYAPPPVWGPSGGYGAVPPPATNQYPQPPPVGPGYPMPPPAGSPPPPATFLCPYCGAPRPAEPVRCPRCGAL